MALRSSLVLMLLLVLLIVLLVRVVSVGELTKDVVWFA